MLCFRRASYDVLKKKLKLLRNVDIALAWLVFFGFLFYCIQQFITNDLERYTSTTYFRFDCFLVGHFWLFELALACTLRSVIEKHDRHEYKDWVFMRIIMEAITICLFLGVVKEKRYKYVDWNVFSNFGLLKITLRCALIPYRIYELLLLKDFRTYIGAIEVSPTPADIENPATCLKCYCKCSDETDAPLPPDPNMVASFLRDLADGLER